jgi:hypothetical protein
MLPATGNRGRKLPVFRSRREPALQAAGETRDTVPDTVGDRKAGMLPATGNRGRKLPVFRSRREPALRAAGETRDTVPDTVGDREAGMLPATTRTSGPGISGVAKASPSTGASHSVPEGERNSYIGAGSRSDINPWAASMAG